MGNRISGISNGLPKSFLEIKNKNFDYQIDALKMAEINEIVVVVGYKADLLLGIF